MIRGIIFDCFGVLYEGSLAYLAELAQPENREAVYDVSLSADYGYISHEEYARRMAELIGGTPEDVERIGRDRHVLNAPMVDFVKSLRGSYKTALLSNAGHGVMNTLFTPEEQADLFDTVVLSSEVGAIKPYPEIYELTASRLDLQPEECIMIDDSPRNVEGAEITGMKGILYGSAEQVKAEVYKLVGTEGHHA